MRRLHRILTLSPSDRRGERATLAGSRSGALGLLDLARETDPLACRGSLDRIGGWLNGKEFGVRIAPAWLERGFPVVAPENLSTVVVAGRVETDWGRVRAAILETGRRPVAEVTDRAAALSAVAAGIDHLIVVGNEAGGFVGEEPSFILLQAVLGRVPATCRVWVRGGIGLATAAGCLAAGAAGVVLDGALWLAKESDLPERVKERVAAWDGVETTVVRARPGLAFRGFAPPGSELLKRLRALDVADGDQVSEVQRLAGFGDEAFWPAGQDTAFAAGYAQRFVTIGGIVQAVDAAIDASLATARSTPPLAVESPLARSHGTRYPIVQGPMTRVSDRPEFAQAVADAGALPFLALAMLRGVEARALLAGTATLLDSKPWGVGLLGFVSPELRREQNAAVLEAKPPFALIAGGRPDQAAEFERAGIATYLHVPSPGLLAQFLRDGARRFVLEGRECGGHVGPRTSFVLWEQAGRVVLDALDRGVEASEIHLLYAGGIHDARSSAVVSAIAAPLAARGVKIGVLVGTAYLFTREATQSGAIVEEYQRETIECSETVLLETGPGHQVRVSPTPFTSTFERERRALLNTGKSADEVRDVLEGMNVGRLRVAAKGVDRGQDSGAGLVPVPIDVQKSEGLYMLGQAATLRASLTTMAELHREISEGAGQLLASAVENARPRRKRRPRPSEIAIVGMASILPNASDVKTFWRNTLHGVDAITEVPDDRWNWRLYYDADPKAPDRITSRWGGFVPDVPFDPLEYGMPPTSLPSIEPLHLLTLEVVRAALADAGYRDRAFPRERTAVVLGAGGGAAQLAMGYAFRSYLPLLDTVLPGAGVEALAAAGKHLPEWTEDSFPGILLNVAAGRVANRFDLGGSNYTVDAACGSSLAAANAAVRELESGAADMVVLGGVDTVQNPFTYLAFSKTQAFSPRGRCRPFDAKADGIVISEGVAVVILKRLKDAERDGDKIYAVIKGMGASSDGRALGLTAPRYEGQVRALKRAYEKADVSPTSIGYVEAHGTGTAAGDLAEVSGLKTVWTEAGAEPGRCALGSVKSLIGHTKCAAGLAGLINASLALHHRVLPPTIGVETENPKAGIAGSPFHISTRSRPWLKANPAAPRRAGVSAFGFGGTNFHAVLEAYEGGPATPEPAVLDWPAELFLWRSDSRESLRTTVSQVARALKTGPAPALRDLAHALANTASLGTGEMRLAIVATSIDDLTAKLDRATARLATAESEWFDPSGLAFAERPSWAGAPVAFLFPGQGSQTPDMLGEAVLMFPEIIDAFDTVDAALARQSFAPIGPLAFPPPAHDDQEAEQQRAALAAPEAAQPALAAASLGLLNVLSRLGIKPDQLAGHSFGELTALYAAGSVSAAGLAELSAARGMFLRRAVGAEPGAMAAVQAGPEAVEPLLARIPGVVLANRNGPKQTVLSGPRAAITAVIEAAKAVGLRARAVPVACGYHSPLVAGASAPLAALAGRLIAQTPRLPVYSNVDASRYANDLAGISRQLGEHVVSSVRFAEMIEAMYRDGARVFIEVGPGNVLTSLVGTILGERPALAAALDGPAGRGASTLLTTLGRLFVAGVAFDARPLTEARSTRRVTIVGDHFEGVLPVYSASTWLVNGSRARPVLAPEPARLGPGAALPVPVGGRPKALPAPEATPASNGVSTGSHAVLAAFQSTMQKFLDVQRSTMLNYLGTAPVPLINAAPVVAPPTAAPVFATSPAPVPAPIEVLEPSPAANGHAPQHLVTAFGPAEVERRLLSIVRDRTGYPAEMLRLELDLEADLGIDSIKRVEIIGTLRDAVPVDLNGSESELIDQLSRAKTLGAIIERMNKHLAAHLGKPAAEPVGAAHTPHRNGKSRKTKAKRMVLEAVDRPLSDFNGADGLVPGGVILITDDGRGVAVAAAEKLRWHGFGVVIAAHRAGASLALDGDQCVLDFTETKHVESLVAHVRRQGALCAILHLEALRNLPPAGVDSSAWAERLGPSLQGLFLIARETADDLSKASRAGGAALVAATAMGGGLASLPDVPESFFPGDGGVAGLVKTLAREWEGVRSRVVDVDPTDDPDDLAALFVAELLADDHCKEAGYHEGRRIALRPVEVELPVSSSEGVTILPGDPILITGGARGITATIARDLAERWRPTLLLVGTTALPEVDDSELAALADPAAVKARLLARLNRHGKTTPAELERAYRAWKSGREVRANLDALRALGATVEYATVDVRNEAAMREILDQWRARFGPLVGVIHAAGVIQDKLLRDKSKESFDRVIGTKLEGALVLARLVEPSALRFAAFFSSVAGRFGNRGQADYAAANDTLNKLAVWLDRRWPARVVSMIWGPWSGVGMVSDLEAHLGRQGLGMIDPADGRKRLGEELIHGGKGVVEVIIAGDLGNLIDDPAPAVEAVPRS